jgi:hypothetical protein
MKAPAPRLSCDRRTSAKRKTLSELQNSKRDKGIWKSCPGVIEEAAHAQSLGPLRFNKKFLSPDVVLVFKQGKKSFIAIGVVVQTRDALFKHHAKAHADFETAGIIRGCAVEGHGEFSSSGWNLFYARGGRVQILLRQPNLNVGAELALDYPEAKLE